MFDNNPQNRFVMKIMGFDPDSVIGPANEPVEKLPSMQNGMPGYSMVPRSKVNDPSTVNSAMWHQDAPSETMRNQIAQSEASLDSIGRAEQMMAGDPQWKEWVGPAAGRWGQWKQSIPGMQVDPKPAAFYATTAQFSNALLYARSGQAINESEWERMQNELPTVNDNPVVYETKMGLTKQNIADLISRRGGQAPSWFQRGAPTAPVGPQAPRGPTSPVGGGKTITSAQIQALAQKYQMDPNQLAQKAQAEGWQIQ